MQGGEETSIDTPSNVDTGALGQVFAPVTAAAGDLVQRVYLRFGHTPDGAPLAFDDAVTAAAADLDATAAEVVERCPHTQVAVVGYTQGAAAVARFAEHVGTGRSRVPAERIAAVALLANPNRPAHTPALPGRPDASTPAPPAGTAGANTAAITLSNPGLSGAGIGTAAGIRGASGYGALAGRVADLCVPGDATCDTPAGSGLARAVANVTARSAMRDPVAAISTVAHALSATIYTTAVEVVNADLTGTSLDQLSYNPTKPLAQRLAEASDPSSVPPGPREALAALFKVGTIGLNAVITVAQKVFTPATIAELATVGLTNPWGAVASLGAKLAGAVVELVPPQTAVRWINDAFDAVTGLITDPGELYQVSAAAHYSDTSGRHGAYQTIPTTDGRSALATVADWLTAAARDLATTNPPHATATTAPTIPTTIPPPTTRETAPPSPSVTSSRPATGGP
ncbi:cutinase family protein [Nocardia cyriacigeorgica]|uniref:cutinase family protein n=1 Tax=Nocardia cyriacigeorgica TaxID=135487 RepID=UPI00148645E1|nr:cutinase family protein [Nocardia cyriacigeorgica]